jgi:hypothetical protein
LAYNVLNLAELGENFSTEEITNTVLSLAKGKSVGADGLPAEFYQTYWSIIKDDIVEMVQTFSRNELDLWRLNRAVITLIRKK